MKPLYTILFSIFLFSSCNFKKDKEQTDQAQTTITNNEINSKKALNKHINVKDNYSVGTKIKLSEIATEIEYIKLETGPDCYIGSGNSIYLVSSEYIFVFNQRRLLQFDINGNFIRQIGKIGRGPGEFISIKGIDIDQKNFTLSIITNFSHKIYEYNFDDGDWIDSYSIDPIAGASMLKGALQILNDDKMLLLSHPFNSYRDNYFVAKIIDKKGNTINVKKSSYFSVNNDDKIKSKSYVVGNQSWRFKNTPRVYEFLNDTIFSIVDNKFVPSFIFDLGNFKGSYEIMVNRKDERRHNYLSFGQFFETYNYLYFLSFYQSDMNICRIDKSTNKFERLLNKNGNHRTFYNDLDGGVDIWPRTSVHNSSQEWISYIDAMEFKQQYEEILSIKKEFIPEKRQKLQQFMNELSIEDNPVLIKIHLKSGA